MGSYKRLSFVLFASLLTIPATIGCKSQTTGNEGNFVFSYLADDNLGDFNKPVAVGAKLDLEITEVGTRKAVQVASANSDNPGVLDVDTFTGNVVTIVGKGEGGALLTVEGTPQGGELATDSVNMLSRVPEVVRFGHTCTTDTASGTYLTGQRVLIPFEMEMSNTQPVIGYGYYPITMEPADALSMDLSVKAQQYMHVDTSETAQSVTLTSDIDGTTTKVELVAAASIDGAVFPYGGEIPAEMGRKKWYHVLPTVAGVPICQAWTDVSITVDTPETCKITLIGQRDDEANLDVANEHGWIEVEGLAEGECNFTATYPAGNNGEGASAALTLTVVL